MCCSVVRSRKAQHGASSVFHLLTSAASSVNGTRHAAESRNTAPETPRTHYETAKGFDPEDHNRQQTASAAAASIVPKQCRLLGRQRLFLLPLRLWPRRTHCRLAQGTRPVQQAPIRGLLRELRFDATVSAADTLPLRCHFILVHMWLLRMQ